MPTIKAICKYCGEVVWRSPAQILVRRNIFCCRDCKDRYYKTHKKTEPNRETYRKIKRLAALELKKRK